jgi:hypothetical protein
MACDPGVRSHDFDSLAGGLMKPSDMSLLSPLQREQLEEQQRMRRAAERIADALEALVGLERR